VFAAARWRCGNLGLATLLLAAAGGCQTTAPLYVWSPPGIASAVGKRVAIAPLAGPAREAQAVRNQLWNTRPRAPGRAVDALDSEQLPPSGIQLASAEPRMPSDLALLPRAREAGVDYLLMGEILPERSARRQPISRSSPPLPAPPSGGLDRAGPSGGPADAADTPSRPQTLAIAWRLYDVAEARPLADRVLVSFARSPSPAEAAPGGDAIDVGPASAAGDANHPAARFASRQLWELLSPSVQRDEVTLAVPWWLPGSAAVRRGNALAQQGDWPAAETTWREALAAHPSQHAALANLAVAAAARQDFSAAKRRIRRAIQQRSRGTYGATLAWIETRQRGYHEAFALPDPPEGWFVTQRAAAAR